MALITVTSRGNFDNTERFFKEMQKGSMYDELDVFAQEGVAALESYTPRRSGDAAGSWYYQITREPGSATIHWMNSDKDDQGVPIVLLIQYGHGTGTGGYVPPYDFINPATEQVFKDASNAVWEAVQSA